MGKNRKINYTLKIVYKPFEDLPVVGSQRFHNGSIQHVFLHKIELINISLGPENYSDRGTNKIWRYLDI
jgi:hypothetical protein